MAILTAGNFYWAGYKPAGRHAAQNLDYVYERGTTLFGSALGIDGGVGGCTGYSWNESGNWYVQLSGFTNDPANPGGFVDGFYYEDATRTPRTDDNVFFSTLTPDDPGIDGFFPASECLFGGITGGDGVGGGTWDSGEGFAAGVCGGNLNKIFLEQDYTSFRGASFQFGNVFGSTFGQQFLGNSANIKIGGFTSMLGRGTTASLLFTNTDGTTVEFLGNTYMFFNGGTGPVGINGLMSGLQNTEEGAGLSAGFTLAANQHFIATTGISGSTFATEALYRGLIRGISSGNLKMFIDGSDFTVSPTNTGVTLIGITQNIPGVGGNIFLTGNLIGYTFGSTADFQSTSDINLLGNTLVGGTGQFVGGSKNNTEQPKLSLKTNTFTIRGDSTISLNDSRVDQQLFVLSGAQYNYKNGRINQAIFNRDRIDYLGPAKTAASLLDTEVANSVVISGGGFQSQTETELVKLDYPEAIDPANIGAGYTASSGPYPNLFFIVNNNGLAFMLPPNTTPGGQIGDGGPLNLMIELGGLASCDDPTVEGFFGGQGGCTLQPFPYNGVGARYNSDLFYGRQRTAEDYPDAPTDPRAGNIERVLSFTEGAKYRVGNGTLDVDLNETPFLGSELGWGNPDTIDMDNTGRMYVRMVGSNSQKEVILLVNNQSPNMQFFSEKGDFWLCDADCSLPAGATGPDFFRSRRWSDAGVSGGEPHASFDVVYESHEYVGGTGGIQPEAYFVQNEHVSVEFIPIPAERSLTNGDLDARKPITYIRPTNTIPNVVIDAMRHGNVVLEGTATTLDMKPEHEHQDANKQGRVFINKPLNFSTRLDYTTINLKSYNDSENIAGTKDNNLLILNAGLTIGNLDIGAGTVSVGTNIGDRKITVVKGEMSSKALLKARSETNPSYQGFRIGDDFTGITSNAEGILISHPAADIEFSVGHYVLASFADGNTGADSGFQSPGGGGTPLPPGLGSG